MFWYQRLLRLCESSSSGWRNSDRNFVFPFFLSSYAIKIYSRKNMVDPRKSQILYHDPRNTSSAWNNFVESFVRFVTKRSEAWPVGRNCTDRRQFRKKLPRICLDSEFSEALRRWKSSSTIFRRFDHQEVERFPELHFHLYLVNYTYVIMSYFCVREKVS